VLEQRGRKGLISPGKLRQTALRSLSSGIRDAEWAGNSQAKVAGPNPVRIFQAWAASTNRSFIRLDLTGAAPAFWRQSLNPSANGT